MLLGLVMLWSLPGFSQDISILNPRFDDRMLKFTAVANTPAGDTVEASLENKFSVQIADGDVTSLTGTGTGSRLDFSMKVPAGIWPGENEVRFFYQKKPINTQRLFLPNPLPGAAQQPDILQIDPLGAAPGMEITVSGRNFGNSIDSLYIWYTDNNDHRLLPAAEKIFNPGKVTFLSTPDVNGEQTLKFICPNTENYTGPLDDEGGLDLLETELHVRVVRQGQPSANAVTINIVKEIIAEPSSYWSSRFLLPSLSSIGFWQSLSSK